MVYSTRTFNIRDFKDWNDRGELELQPKFQRRDVWSNMAKSYLIDTIIRKKPVPKIYLRMDINPISKKQFREVVDGQQRIRTVLSFLDDGFKISKSHNYELRGKSFSDLDIDIQRDFLKWEFAVDILYDLPDKEIFDIFARLNTYSLTLKDQELRHAKYFGEFRSSAYLLANEFNTFWIKYKIFTHKQILRMREAEFVSELLISISDGIHDKTKRIIDGYYANFDEEFPNRRSNENKFRNVLDTLGELFQYGQANAYFKSNRLLYPLFCATFHMLYGLPKYNHKRMIFKKVHFARISNSLEEIGLIIEKNKEPDMYKFTKKEKRFLKSYSEHWVHRSNRIIRTSFICDSMIKAINK